jgi:hypothetical protein
MIHGFIWKDVGIDRRIILKWMCGRGLDSPITGRVPVAGCFEPTEEYYISVMCSKFGYQPRYCTLLFGVDQITAMSHSLT